MGCQIDRNHYGTVKDCVAVLLSFSEEILIQQ